MRCKFLVLIFLLPVTYAVSGYPSSVEPDSGGAGFYLKMGDSVFNSGEYEGSCLFQSRRG